MKNGLRFSATLVLGLVMLGCPGSLSEADKPCFLQEERAHIILVASCAYGGCHSEKDKSTGLDLESPGTGKRLAGKASIACSGPLIEAGNPDASAIYTKLSDPPPCGSRMPLAHPELADEDKEAIRVWIAGLNGSCSGAGGAGGTTTTTSSGGAGDASGGTGGTTTSSGGMGGAGGATGGMAGMGGM